MDFLNQIENSGEAEKAEKAGMAKKVGKTKKADKAMKSLETPAILSGTRDMGRNPEKVLAVSCMLVNLDDNGRQMTKSSILRVFRNDPSIRFIGRIHEQITVDIKSVVHASDITIYHTGYSQSVHQRTGKAQRNIALLREELAANPKNLNLKAYLANSLSMGDEKSQKEAEKLFTEIINSKASVNVNNVLRVKMYIFMINRLIGGSGGLAESEEMCRKAMAAFPNAIDFEYLLADLMSKKGDYDKAWELLNGCEEKLVGGRDSGDSIMIPADPTILFAKMILAAKDLGDIENVLLYSTHVLSMDKERLSVLGPCIATMLHYGISEPETIELLSNIYDFNNPEDVALIAKAAKSCGAAGFAERVVTNKK